MKYLRWIVPLLLLLVAQSAFSADESPAAIHVQGAVAQPSDWSADRLEKDFAADVQTVSFTSHGKQHSAKCVSLLALLKKAGVPTDLKMNPKADPKVKNYPLRLAIVVTARDGYVSTFSLGELLPDTGHEAVWLAVEIDGQPLTDRDAPARLIVPGDKLPARGVFGIGTITVIDTASSATTRPG